MTISLALTDPGAIPDRDTLISTVSDWLDRGTSLDDKIPTFIQLAEAQFNRELRSPEMENTITFSASSEDTPMPASDYLAMRAMYVEGSPDRPLRAMAPTALRQQFDGSTGTPVAYSLVGGGIRLAPPPSDEILLTMDYFARIQPLSVSVPSNWLLEKHPGAYLYGTLFNAEAYLDNPVRAGQWKALTDEIVQSIARDARNNRYGAGPLVPNTAQQVPAAKC
jgi:hypothetical protein